MSELRPFASLSPSLLARKGTARPAMRSPVQPVLHYRDALARAYAPQDDSGEPQSDDLGWNDMGPEHDVPPLQDAAAQMPLAAVPANEDGGAQAEVAISAIPEIVAPLAESTGLPVASLLAPAITSRRSALLQGRRAAFTLRLDAERHLKLRLACTLEGRSAQTLLTEALDRLLENHPHVESLAQQVRDKR